MRAVPAALSPRALCALLGGGCCVLLGCATGAGSVAPAAPIATIPEAHGEAAPAAEPAPAAMTRQEAPERRRVLVVPRPRPAPTLEGADPPVQHLFQEDTLFFYEEAMSCADAERVAPRRKVICRWNRGSCTQMRMLGGEVSAARVEILAAPAAPGAIGRIRYAFGDSLEAASALEDAEVLVCAPAESSS